MAKPSDILILVPTELEQRQLTNYWSGQRAVTVETCGFGMIAAAARTSQLIAHHQPESVVLVGIAGTYIPELAIGSAYQCDEVACYGVGVGTGSEHRTAGDMGWPHWPGNPDSVDPGTDSAIGDVIALRKSPTLTDNSCKQLLTVSAASGSADEALMKKTQFPRAAAEDMEGFAVALACKLHAVPVAIVRGISNLAGDRNHAKWEIDQAMQSATRLTQEIIDQWTK